MKKKHESGHAVFLSNFSRLIMICEEADTAYSPPDTKISIVNLKIKDEKQKTAYSDYQEAAGVYRTNVDVLQHILAPIDKKITRVVNVVKACDVTKEFIDTVKSTGKRIAGIRITPKITKTPGDEQPPSDEEIKQISAAQTGIDNKIAHIEELIQILKNEPNYLPNEADLKITALETDVTSLKDARADADSSKFHTEAKRIARDAEMYTAAGSGAELSGKVKAYFKAAFGGNSKQYHDIAALKFNVPR